VKSVIVEIVTSDGSAPGRLVKAVIRKRIKPEADAHAESIPEPTVACYDAKFGLAHLGFESAWPAMSEKFGW
jgi:hypothetical protein